MPFYPPEWVPQCPEIPDSVSIPEFMFEEKHGRTPISESADAYICGLTGKKTSAAQQKEQYTYLARALAKEFGWKVNEGTEFDKVCGVFALNTIDVMTLNWAIHRLNGVSSPANAAYSADELRHQLMNSDSKALFTVMPLLEVALEGAQKAGVDRSKIYLLSMPGDDASKYPKDLKTFDQLVEAGKKLPELEQSKWEKGQGARQTAFLCYSSGTSGLPKGVMISHRNVIANTLQIKAYDQKWREKLTAGGNHNEVALGLLPQSHIYGLIVICHESTYLGHSVVVLPKFDMQNYLNSIQKYKITTLYIVPPIIIGMVKQKELCSKYDLSSVVSIFTGAAPLGQETAVELSKQYPKWKVRQGYGLTETCTVVCSTQPEDIVFGSSGCLLPGYTARVMSIEGNEITGYDQPGELLVKSPSVTLGYLKNEKATKETFVDLEDGRYMRTGDEVVFKKASSGSEHVWIVDRLKELIKVKGLQVAPAELEAALLGHPAVADCAVIPAPDERAGEVPRAYVVKSNSVGLEESDAAVKRDIQRFIEKEKARHKWLKGGIEFIDVIPKSPSGKILRRMLRDKDKAARMKKGAKL
ncbi:hypothetical protein LTS08_002318 [Lithohypha guttulata]|nr:hypothetical protein LTS08_002318 [Lithohypha guttulata]